ncbi:hypothetical protein JCGZ_07867 [Jatropha curcas]|uniref:Arabidopsis retrotransposon Orf1 C-terminal domain-containing protein n=1 Tax=Jatropha curcas TaxID=180498 RepID=A0A067KXT4_JATCU|nr:hypothetical protein JCGZ_07867 [Jatropha curcas]
MPFKQKARKTKEGSSSSAPARKDLATRFKAPFPIYTIAEGERYTRLAKCTFTGMYLLDPTFLQDTGILEKVQEYLKTLNFEIFSQLQIPENAKLSLELLTTVDWVDEDQMAINFRVDGEELTVGYDQMHEWLGFPKSLCAPKQKGWNASSVWEKLTGQSAFTPRNSGNKWIKDESILYLHKYLCYALFGRVEASKVQTRDLFILDCILQGKRVDVAGIILDTIYNASRHQGKVTFGIGSLAPILAHIARMPIPPYQPQPTDTFRHGKHELGTASAMKELRMHKRKDSGRAKHRSHVASSSHAEEEEDDVAGWRQVLGKVEALQQSQETLQATVLDMGHKLLTIQKNHERMERKWMKYFHHKNIEFTPSPPGSPEA